MNQMPANSCNSLLQEIRKVDFSIVETVLFLDAYPNDADALDYYSKLIQQKNALVDRYEKTCGPLTVYGNQSSSSWDWIKTPFPWETEANEI